jgi:hypothetical protein
MANSFTANLNLEKPEVGADSNLWGGHINSDLDLLDSIFTTATTRPIASQILSSTRILDSATTTKSILLVLSGITTTTGRNLTVQDADGTLAYTAQIATATAASATTGQVAAATVGVALLAGAAFTGTVTGITTTASDNSTKMATTAYVDRLGGASALTNSLSGDVTLNNNTLFFTGPQVAQGSSGTWYATGTVTVTDTSGSANFGAILWDGTNIIASGTGSTAGAGVLTSISLSGSLASPAGNIRIAVKDITTNAGFMRFNFSGGGKDCTLSVYRIA